MDAVRAWQLVAIEPDGIYGCVLNILRWSLG